MDRKILELSLNIYDNTKLCALLEQKGNVIFHGQSCSVCVGNDFPVKVNTNIGVSDPALLKAEIEKLRLICQLTYSPDCMMDHTIIPLKKPFWKIMIEEFEGPVGALPHYLAFDKNTGLKEKRFLDILEDMVRNGIGFFTLHPTPSHELYEIAKRTRKLPTTSRGGGLVLRDLIESGKSENVIAANFERILAILKEGRVGLSIGSTFRPANIFEALDEVHRKETFAQIQFVRRAQDFGVKVIMEGIGHIDLNGIPEYANLIKGVGVPFMPLGPMPTESAIGFDHVASAIGAAVLCFHGGANIINSITREEHTGNVPTAESVIEGLQTAKVVAHSINILRFEQLRKFDQMISNERQSTKTCTISGGLFALNVIGSDSAGCARCKHECPLLFK